MIAVDLWWAAGQILTEDKQVRVEILNCLKSGRNFIKEARGFLRGKQFSTSKYFQMKKEDKDLEG